MVRGGTGRYGVVRNVTGLYGVVCGGMWRYRMVRDSTERSNKSRIGYPVYPACKWWYLAVKEYNIIRKTWVDFLK